MNMKRRDFSRMVAGTAIGSAVWSEAFAQWAPPTPGKDYYVVNPRAPVDAPAGKIDVVEFFWYSCPHCNAIEPAMPAWIKKLPMDAAFRRVPVAFNDSFAPQQRLYFALDAMGLVEKLHAKVFQAIHAEKQQLARGDAIFDWVAKQGVDRTKFESTYNSAPVSAKSAAATALQNSYKVEGVPAIGVAGRFYTDGSIAGTMERALQIGMSLISEARRAS
jgi:thiol:disulfide interchange protein DsbA